MLLAETSNASVPGADLLRLLFDLTPAEARLTRLLVEGNTLAAAARQLKVTEGTARTHLRGVFAKTGVERQAGLVRLLLGLGAPG
jgi:DNA-binding CsgD family transcriptional regulator